MLAADRSVSVGTAHRAVSLLAERGYVDVVPGRGFCVADRTPDVAVEGKRLDLNGVDAGAELQPVPICRPSSVVLLDLVVLRHGQVLSKFSAAADPRSAEDLRRLLVDAVRRRGGFDAQIVDYEMELRRAGDDALITTFVTSSSSARQ